MAEIAFPDLGGSTAARTRLSTARWLLGLALLTVAAGACALLALDHFGAARLPGCGEGSDCARAAASRWGRIIGWPASFLGLAYFLALLAAWSVAGRGGVASGFKHVARLGFAVSVFYSGVMLIEQLYCVYCVAAHVANLAFWLTVECSPAVAAPFGRYGVAAGGTFALSMAVLSIVDAEHRWSQQSAAEARVQESIDRIRIGRDETEDDAPAPADSGAVPETAARIPLRAAQPRADAPSDTSRQPHRGLEGRYPLGPGDARARLVVFYDYQCEHCQDLDRELNGLRQQFPSLSVSIRHYPLCTDCNYLFTTNTHPNACRAARAAEAAGLLRGTDGFWQFHEWLVERKGDFTDEALRAGVAELGYESPDVFVAAMEGETARRHVLEDIIEAEVRNVERTPTVFVNGIVLEDWSAERALARAVAAAVERPGASNRPDDESEASAGRFSAAVRERSVAATVRIVNATRAVQGSGVIAGQDRSFFYILTARHLVSPGDRLEVHTFDRTTASEPRVSEEPDVIARAGGGDDLAIVRVRAAAERLPFLPICPSEQIPDDGLAAISVGCSEGEAPTVVVHAVLAQRLVKRHAGERESLTWESVEPAVPGRSGGPLVDERGCVIGIQSGSAESRGYYTHASAIQRLLAERGLEWLISRPAP